MHIRQYSNKKFNKEPVQTPTAVAL